MGWFKNKNYPLHLLLIYLAFLGITAINPPHPHDFILEHVMTAVFISFLILTRKKFPLSHVSYTLIFVFMILHTVGAHYTYAEVPYDRFFTYVFGVSINGIFGFSRDGRMFSQISFHASCFGAPI